MTFFGQAREGGGWLQHCRTYLLCDGDDVAGYNAAQRGVTWVERSTAL